MDIYSVWRMSVTTEKSTDVVHNMQKNTFLNEIKNSV